MQTEHSSTFAQPIIPLAVINSIISQLPALYNGKFPIRDPNAPRHNSHASRSSQSRIPRPSNPFILFRTVFVRNKDVLTFENKHQDLSIIAGKVWKSMNGQEKKPWYDEAAKVKDEHRRAYPDYSYSPSPVSPSSAKRKVRKGNSEEEKKARRQRCVLAATQIRQAMPSASHAADGNDSDGVSEISAISKTNSSTTSSSSGSGFNSGITSSESSPSTAGTGNAVTDTISTSTSTLPSKRNAGGAQKTSGHGWLAHLTQPTSLVPPSSSQSLFTRSDAAGTINPANLRLANPVIKPSAANVWGLRDSNANANHGFITPSPHIPSFTSTSAFRFNASSMSMSTSSSSAFGQNSWNTANRHNSTRSSFPLASSSNAEGRARQNAHAYAISDEELDANNDDVMDDDDSDLDY